MRYWYLYVYALDLSKYNTLIKRLQHAAILWSKDDTFPWGNKEMMFAGFRAKSILYQPSCYIQARV